ncbi:MAG: PAS domain-containing protein [Acidimicrobiia bacterium]
MRSDNRAEAALIAAEAGVWDWNMRTGELYWDDTVARLLGVDPASFDGTLEGFFTRVHPDDLPGLRATIETAAAQGGSFITEFRVVSDEGTRWIQGRGAVLRDEQGETYRTIGLGVETTALRSTRERAGRSLDNASDGLVLFDTDWRILYVNPAAGRLVGRDLSSLVGHHIGDKFPEALDTTFFEEGRRAVKEQQAVRFEAFYEQLGSWFELQMFPAPDGLTVFFRNIDDQRRREAEREGILHSLEIAIERVGRLQEITARLAETQTVAEVARVILTFTRRALGTRHAGIALTDTEGEVLEFQLPGELPDETRDAWARIPLEVDAPIAVCARSGGAMFHESQEDLLAEFPGLAGTAGIVGQGAFANIALMSAGRPIGVLSVSWPRTRKLSTIDREFLATIAGQCALAIERSLLLERERSTARMLQRAILPELGHALGPVACAARYLPAESGIEVGGDWYDAFLLPDGAVALVVGDVTGHGLSTAATMAQLRNMLRGYTFDSPSPSAALGHLNSVLLESGSTSSHRASTDGTTQPPAC